ncbi:CGL57 [Auxenochlorella protothecoides x Auxenochlorella symbiontica]
MATRAWNLRYSLLKLKHAVSEAVASPHQGSVADVLQTTVEAYQRRLTQVIALAGVSMAPTLNPLGTKDPGAVEQLLVRQIPRPSTSNVWVGDVVALKTPSSLQPISLANTEHVDYMVRRVAAMPGEELVTDDPEDEPVVLQQGQCWVLADNEELQPPAVLDSRTFGPLDLSSIIGRVLYAARSPSDHGPVENSTAAMQADVAVLEAELDIDKLCKQEQ